MYPLIFISFLIGFLLSSSSSALMEESHVSGQHPIRPSQDPFYNAPLGYKNTTPGTLLRHRFVPNPLLVGPEFGSTGNVKAAFQILYRTTDGLDRAAVAVTTLIIPHHANFSKLLSYQEFYNTDDPDCSPSYTLQQGQKILNSEGALISAALRQGWCVLVPDYEGPKAAFTVGRQEGFAVLDGLRAALKSKSFTNISSPRIALYGYSGGSIATEWAVELHPSYAPDLKIVGAAFGGLAPNLTSAMLGVNGHTNSDLIPSILLGFGNQYKNISESLGKYLKRSKALSFNGPLSSCSTSELQHRDIFSFFTIGKAFLNIPSVKQAFASNGVMGNTNIPTIPLYVYKSSGDTISHVKETDRLVHRYCAGGASIRYIRNQFGTHNTELFIGFPYALRWIKDRLNGKPSQPRACSIRNENITHLHPSSARILGGVLYKELRDALSQSAP